MSKQHFDSCSIDWFLTICAQINKNVYLYEQSVGKPQKTQYKLIQMYMDRVEMLKFQRKRVTIVIEADCSQETRGGLQ